jgi:hypothetical protein
VDSSFYANVAVISGMRLTVQDRFSGQGFVFEDLGL